MVNETLPDQLRAQAAPARIPDGWIDGSRLLMRAAAHELEERAGQLCELRAEIERLRAGDYTSERAAHPALILGPGMRIEPHRRAVLIRAPVERLGAVDAIARCGPTDTAWRVKVIDYRGMDGDEPLFRVELEPVDAHAVPLDVPVRVLPFPSTDLGWVPIAGRPPAVAQDGAARP